MVILSPTILMTHLFVRKWDSNNRRQSADREPGRWKKVRERKRGSRKGHRQKMKWIIKKKDTPQGALGFASFSFSIFLSFRIWRRVTLPRSWDLEWSEISQKTRQQALRQWIGLQHSSRLIRYIWDLFRDDEGTQWRQWTHLMRFSKWKQNYWNIKEWKGKKREKKKSFECHNKMFGSDDLM